MIEEADMKRLREVFMTREECNTTNDEINKKLANDSTELALIKQKLDMISFFTKTTLGVVVAAIVGALLKLIILG